jgi:transposase
MLVNKDFIPHSTLDLLMQRMHLLECENEKWRTEAQKWQAECEKWQIENAQLKEEIKRLQELLLAAQQRHFGKKSEVSLGEDIVVDPLSEALQTVLGYTRRHRKPADTLDTSLLPSYPIYHALPEGATCSCGCALKKIGADISEQLEVLPKRLYILKHIRSKYTCLACKTITMAPKPMAPIPKAMAGGSLLTEVIVDKYVNHLPLYRQSKIFASYGARIPDNTLGAWVMQAGDGLMPVYEELEKAALVRYVQADETPVKILKSDKKGYLWAYYSPTVGQGLVFFELRLTRSGSVAEERLKNFKGLLQTDGYCGYKKLREREDLTGFGCMTHARRKYSEVLKITKNTDGIAAEMIKRLKPLYALEAKLRNQMFNIQLMSSLPKTRTPNQRTLYVEKQEDTLKYIVIAPNGEVIENKLDILVETELTQAQLTALKPMILEETAKRGHIDVHASYHTRKRLRQKYIPPLLKSLHQYLKQVVPKIPPKSKLGEAVNYMITQWPYITAYVNHGTVEIDTNLVENIIRPFALGRKNWMFINDQDSGTVHALWYSLVLSAIMNGLNPRIYIHFLLTKIHDIRRGLIDPRTLLPHIIDRTSLAEFSTQQIAFAQKVFDSS